MANNDKPQTDNKLQSLAFELFTQRSAMLNGRSAEPVASQCFRDAESFLKVAEKVEKSGLASIADSSPLDPAFAANLKKTHPINLMSKEWGDLKRVREALKFLEENPSLESYEELSWGKPEVNQARALFPTVVQRADSHAKVVA